VSSSLSMRVRVRFLTSGIRAVLSCSINISCSSPSHASLSPQPAAGTPAVPAHPSSPAQTSSSSSETASSPRSSPPLVHHVRRTVSVLGRLERAAPAEGRDCRGRGTRASAAETAATAARLTMTELSTTRAEVEAAAAADAACATAAELEALRASSTGSSVSVDDNRDNELKLTREAAREQAAQWAPWWRCSGRGRARWQPRQARTRRRLG
jgi:hypothetical protein